VLALGLKFPLTNFVYDLLCHYHLAPYQLVVGGWHIVLSFQALCNWFIPDACRVEDFSTLYMIRRTKEGRCFFTVRSGFKKLIVNLADSNHGWRDTVTWSHGASEMVEQGDTHAQRNLGYGRGRGEGPKSASN